MPLNADAIRAHQFPPVMQTVEDRDFMLYALSLGLGSDPWRPDELPYVYEDGLRAFPTMAVVLGHPGAWMAQPQMGIDQKMRVHGSQRLAIHAPIVAGTPMVCSNRILEVVDKGLGRGAIIVTERCLREQASGRLLSRTESGTFCRSDGGFGGPAELSHAFLPTPQRPPDFVCDMPTSPNQALLYRLNGDRNPLHASPNFAARAGFPRPILHGLCTFGVAAHALMRHGGETGQLASLETRFSKPVFPGETVRFEVWRESGSYAFRALVAARQAVVLDRGRATFA